MYTKRKKNELSNVMDYQKKFNLFLNSIIWTNEQSLGIDLLFLDSTKRQTQTSVGPMNS